MVAVSPLKLLTVPDAAARLGVSPRKIWKLIAEGKLPTVRVGDRATRISEAAMATFIADLPSAR